MGRALGGPVGGWLTDTVGWRWSFYGQCPLTVLGLLVVVFVLPSHTTHSDELEPEATMSEKIKRVDFLGALTLATAITTFLLCLDFATKEAPWYHTLVLASISAISSVAFYLTERRTEEPILPIELITKQAVLTSYAIAAAQMAAQFSLFYAVPIYFQIAAGTSVADAGLRLVPSVVGNAVGGLLSGYIISKTGRYKALTICASAAACVGYVLVLVFWRGNTQWPQILYIFLGGFGSGVIQSTTFIHLVANLAAKEIATVGTTLFLVQNLSVSVGVQVSTAVLRARLRPALEIGLRGVKHKKKVCITLLRPV